MFIPDASSFILSTWVPFVTPAPLWDYWWALLLPLLAAVAVVYKCTKRGQAGQILAEAAQLWLYIVVAMALGAVALILLVNVVLE
jgi:hypothetical protein